MSQLLKVIEAAKSGDTAALKTLLEGGANANEQDDRGWSPLSWAAGRGDAEAVSLLLEHGGDVALTGQDQRTPLMIATAADHKEVVEILTEAEKRRGVWQDPSESQPYCKAYYLRDLRRFLGWSESRFNWQEPAGDGPGEAPLLDGDIAYLHQDFTVTKSMWHGESVLFNQVTPEWRAFCESELGLTSARALLDLHEPGR